MANYSYTNGGNGDNPKGSRFGGRFQSWGNAYAGAETTDGWSKSDYLGKPEVRKDHVCRPVIIGADGKAIPGVLDCPHEHHNNNEGNTKDYKVGYNMWNQSEGVKKEETPRAPESISNVQTAASESGRMGFPGGMFRRQKIDSYGVYGSNNDESANGWSRPSYEKYENSLDEESEPTMINSGGWARPGRSGWAVPPEASNTKAPNDIGTLKESARLLSVTNTVPDRWSSQSTPMYYGSGKNDGSAIKRSAAKTIDSREAAKKYGGQFIW